VTTSNATLSGSIKNELETAGLGVSVFRSVAPPKAHLPFCVVTEGIAWATWDQGDADALDELTVREQVQVDVYQGLRASDGTRTEETDLEDQICYLLSKTRLPTWVYHVFGVRVIARSHVVGEDTEDNVKRTIVTLQVDRMFVPRTGA
jgi:hypothetical protein